MPTFIFNKLIRDKLKGLYVELNQDAEYKDLTSEEFTKALKQKLLEEVKELVVSDSREDLVSELADIQQVVQDLMDHEHVSADEVEAKRIETFNKKGGFTGAHYVTTLRLQDGDKWVDYYRKSPDVFKEVSDE
ncbi:MAG: nucleoside triphosphate pyrophosphohydrolase [Candidatus Microsaccharimonas sp.]